MARTGVLGRELRGREERASLSRSPTVLVVAPEPRRAGEVVGALQDGGIPSVQASTAPQAVFWARRSVPGLVLLDTRTRGARILLGEFRGEGRPVVALNDDEGERVRALEAGCLDALPNSMAADELALKVTRLARSDGVQAEEVIVAGPLSVDLSRRQLVWRGERLRVSPQLLRLAAYLAGRPGRLTPARILLENVWGEPWAEPNKVHQAMYRLRRRLDEPADSSFLIARWGHGYGLFPEPYRKGGGFAMRTMPS